MSLFDSSDPPLDLNQLGKGRKVWTKTVLLVIPSFYKTLEVPVLLMIRILEPVYIAIARSADNSEFALQFNMFDTVTYESTVSYAQVIHGFMAIVRYSWSGRMLPTTKEVDRWESGLCAACTQTLILHRHGQCGRLAMQPIFSRL